MSQMVRSRWVYIISGILSLLSSFVSRYIDDKFDYEPEELSVERQMEIHHDKITQGVVNG